MAFITKLLDTRQQAPMGSHLLRLPKTTTLRHFLDHTPPPPRRESRSELPSSDPPDETLANPYPEIATFLTKLHERNPRRLLNKHISDFEGKDYYNIDEIVKLTEERLTGPDFDMTPGNVQFLIASVRNEMKRIDKGKKRT